MSHKIKLFAAPLVLAASMVAAPALAEIYNPYEMRNEISQMRQRLERIGEGRDFTNSEYRRMLNAVESLETSYRQYGRDGFSRREIAGLSERIDNVRDRINIQARDHDRLQDRDRDDRDHDRNHR